MNETKSSNKIKLLFVLVLVLLSSLFLVNCTEDSDDSLLGEEYIESQTDITLVDTFDVEISTMILDTLQTSGTGNILLGSYEDDVFGGMHSDSYLELGVPDTFYVYEDDIYDSLTFVMTYSGYSFGDTTQTQKFSVHHLTENIEPDDDDDYLTAGAAFSYDPEPLGSVEFTPKPQRNINDTIRVRLDDELGEELFDMLYDISDYVANDEIFIRHFYGFALIADESYGGCIIGFNGSDGDAAMILHTTRPGITETEIDYVFQLVEDSYQFNNITHDFQSTPLEGLEEQENELPSTESDDLAFIQGGVGLTIRVDFPSLENILMLERGTIMEAELVLAPANTTIYDYDLPSDLSVYEVGIWNKLTDSGISSSVLTTDNLYNENTYYSFDITDYIKDEIEDYYVDPDKGLLITIPSSDLQGSFDRLIIDAQNKNTELKIYYMTY